MKVRYFAGIAPCFCSLLLSLSTCMTPIDQINLSELPVLATLEKGPCYGRCPVFTLTIYENGVVTYEGKRFTEREGLHYRKLDKKEIAEIQEKFRQADFFSFQRVYPSRLPDLATVTLTFSEDNKSWSVMGKDGRPDKVVALENFLDKIANTGEWISRERDTEKEQVREIIVQLQPEQSVPEWLEKYREWDLDAIRKLTPNANNWLLDFNPEKISAEELLKLLQRDEAVLSAQINLNLELR